MQWLCAHSSGLAENSLGNHLGHLNHLDPFGPSSGSVTVPFWVLLRRTGMPAIFAASSKAFTVQDGHWTTNHWTHKLINIGDMKKPSHSKLNHYQAQLSKLLPLLKPRVVLSVHIRIVRWHSNDAVCHLAEVSARIWRDVAPQKMNVSPRIEWFFYTKNDGKWHISFVVP